MRLRYTRAALSDLSEAEAFVRARDPAAATVVMRRIEAAIDRLPAFPESGRRGRVEGTRELVIPETPFVVACRLTSGSIDILSLVHSARRWPSSFGEGG